MVCAIQGLGNTWFLGIFYRHWALFASKAMTPPHQHMNRLVDTAQKHMQEQCTNKAVPTDDWCTSPSADLYKDWHTWCCTHCMQYMITARRAPGVLLYMTLRTSGDILSGHRCTKTRDMARQVLRTFCCSV